MKPIPLLSDRLSNLAHTAYRLFTRIGEALFLPGQSRLANAVAYTVQAGLFLLGIGHWTYFLNWGKISFNLHDWAQEGWRYFFLQQAVRTGQLPLHVSTGMTHVDRFIARPDTVLSPQLLLLAFLDLGPFVLVNTLLLYAIGFAGLLLIGRKYRLSPAAFTALFLLFNFNGHITIHLAIGHTMWVGYFLLPFFIYLLLELVDRYPGQETSFRLWRWVALVALVLFATFLQGSWHQFIWSLIFLAALGIFYTRYARPAFLAVLFSLLLSLVRVLPPAIQFFEQGVQFMSGFISVTDMLQALVVLKAPAEALAYPFANIEWWETDHYIGLLGLAFVLFFGVYQTWKSGGVQKRLFAPGFVLALLSIGYIYYPVNLLPLPLADSERVTARFLIMPLAVLMVLGSIRFQEYLNSQGKASLRQGLFYLALLALMGHDLLQHSRIWRYTNMYALWPITNVDIRAYVSNHADPPYIAALVIGLTGTLATAGLLIFMSARREQKDPTT